MPVQNETMDAVETTPLYLQIAAQLAELVRNGTLARGEKMPSVRELARQHGISTFTVTDAYQRLVSLGLVTARRGAGYRVQDAGLPRRDAAPAWVPPRLDADWLLSEVYADQSVPIKTGCGWLPGEWVIEPGLRNALRAASRLPAEQFGDYGHPYGHAALRVTSRQCFVPPSAAPRRPSGGAATSRPSCAASCGC